MFPVHLAQDRGGSEEAGGADVVRMYGKGSRIFHRFKRKRTRGSASASDPFSVFSGLAVAAEDVDELVPDHLLDVLAGDLQVTARVKERRILHEHLTAAGSESEAEVRVDVDLADC